MSELVNFNGLKVYSKEKFEQLTEQALQAIPSGTFLFVQEDGSELENLKDYLEALIIILQGKVSDLESLMGESGDYLSLINKLKTEGYYPV